MLPSPVARLLTRVALTLMFSLLTTRTGWAQLETPTPPGTPAETVPGTLEYPAEASPDELLGLVESAWQTPIEAETRNEENAMKIRVLRHIITGAEKVLGHADAKEQTALSAAQNKMQALGILAQAGDPDAPLQAISLAQDLAQDKRPLLAREGKLILLSSRLREIPQQNAQEHTQFGQELMELLASAELNERELQIANITATLFEQTGDTDAARVLFERAAELMKKSKSPAIRAQAAEFEGSARRLALPGNPLKLTGETLGGEKFDIQDYKGKVVLVQFWASWCTYCLQEMPHIRQAYNTYRDRGFEVVGVNLDDSAGRAREIVVDSKLPWPQLFSSDPAALGMQNPVAVYYGINSIPQCILVDREGKVITLQARGGALEAALEKLFPSTAAGLSE